MRRALRLSAFLLGVLAISSQADARMGGGGSGFSFSPGFGGFSGGLRHAAPSGHFVNGSHQQSFLHGQVFAARRFRALRLRSQQAFAPTAVLYGGDWWWPDMGQVVTYAPASEAPAQPEVIVIQNDRKEPTVAEATPNYDYVAGCHAIPNGCHCDTGGVKR